jgi:Peptidoglycan-binding protein, CsiV
MKRPQSEASPHQHYHRFTNAAAIAVMTCATLLASSASYSAQPTSGQWYQIELFVFANTNPLASVDERWPEDLGLKYPKNIVVLRKDSSEQVDLDTLLSESPTLADNVNPNQPTGNRLQPINEQSQVTPVRVSNLVESELVESELVESGQPALSAVRSFVLLDPSEHTLTKAVNRILAQSDFKPLFHGAWRQLIGKRTKSASLLIRGGDAYDEHFELEGSINLSVERYLHINTDLWLSSFVRNSQVDQPLWPVLPRAPIPAAAQNADNTAVVFASANGQSTLNFDGTKSGGSTLEASLQQSLEGSFNNLFDIPFQESNDNEYSVQQTVVMRQHRRMRSKELHYIDHPKFGLLIKIIPFNSQKDAATQ